MKNDKRFIEESFPVKEVSAESAREKNIRHGYISTLHLWRLYGNIFAQFHGILRRQNLCFKPIFALLKNSFLLSWAFQKNVSVKPLWWTRKPLAASRATAYAALIPAPQNIEEWQKERYFIYEDK